jgi:hypothetical protein
MDASELTRRLDELVDLVAAMREAQRDYFKTRSPSSLESAKFKERAVDMRIAELRNRQELLF